MQGWTLLKNEFQESFREITMLGFGIIFIAHEKNKATNLIDENGDAISAVAPDIPQAAYTIVNGIVDIIGYISVEDFDENTQLGKRYLYTRQTPRIFAGSRYKYLEPKIPFGYDELVNAIGDALEKDAKTDKEYYVKGIVCEVKEISTQYGNATFWISDDGSNDKATRFYVFRAKDANGASITNPNRVKVGDRASVRT